jgi:butyryl-CoA dehydrogenase
MDEADGGFQLPHVVYRVAFMWFQAANLSTISYAMLTVAAAHLIHEHASSELVEKYVPPMLDGRWYGTMNLSEPGIGSSLGDLKTSAVRQPDGTYRVRGDKMWISGGEHDLSENIVHLVLARTGGPGTKGLSLFVVPKWLGEPGELGERNDVSLVGLNHKMGYRGTVNTALSYGSGTHPVGDAAGNATPGAVGYLIGDEGEGLRYMFLMMNEARIAVGASAAALGMSSFLHARKYARERLQGRELSAKDPSLPQVPLTRHPDVRRMLMLMKAYTEGGAAVSLYTAKLLDESESAATEAERAAADLLIDIITPVAKSWPSQWCLVANDLAIQVLGGSGYTRDFPLEQFYRDNRLNPIHEGTHGIQGLDLLGRKVRMHDGAAFTALLARIRETLARVREGGANADGALADGALADLVAARVDTLESVTATLWAEGNAEQALANATTYLEAAGDVVVAWLLLDQLTALAGRDDAFARAKRQTVAFFVTHVLPRVDPQFALLESRDQTLVELEEGLI